MKRTVPRFGILAVVSCFYGTADCFAQAAAATHTADKTFWDLFHAGGFMMWVMLAVSMFAMSLIIECAARLRRQVIVPPDLVEQFKSLLSQGNYQEAWRVANARPCPFSRVIAGGLESVGRGKDEVNAALEEHALQEALMMKTRVNYLSVIGVVSPMLGLIGTVVGMIEAFQVISHTIQNPALLAEAIGKVLVATAFGLFIAVPAFFAYYFFRNRAQAMIVLLQDKVTRLMRDLPYAELQGLRIGEELESQAGPAAVSSIIVPTASLHAASVVSVRCPNCNQPIPPGTSPCSFCGAQLQWT